MAGPVPVKRALAPSLNPAGYMAAAGAVYAAAVMVYNAVNHHGVISLPVIIAALGAAWSLYTRFKVTPVGDPRDGNGQPLIAAPPPVLSAGPVPGSYGIPQAGPPAPDPGKGPGMPSG